MFFHYLHYKQVLLPQQNVKARSYILKLLKPKYNNVQYNDKEPYCFRSDYTILSRSIKYWHEMCHKDQILHLYQDNFK